jgi:hypothetical protein
MKGIYKFDADFGRMGDLSGVFVATDAEIEEIIGNEIYFGEVLGKHSEVFLTVEEDNFTLITNDEKFIEMFEQYGLENGHNPFDHFEGEEDDEDEDSDEDETE